MTTETLMVLTAQLIAKGAPRIDLDQLTTTEKN